MIPEYINAEETKKAVGKQRDKIDKIIDSLKNPDLDFRKIKPEDYKLLARYEPKIAQFVAEKNPELVSDQGAGAVAGRASQMAALNNYRQLGQNGDDLQSRIATNRALQAAAQQNQGQQASIMDQFARRGQAGSGNSLIAQLMAQQGSDQRAQQGSQQAALDSTNRRLEALRQGAALGGTVRGEDVNLSGQNAAILNDYNKRFATNQNLYNQYAADESNSAQKFNMGNAQDIANKNVSQGNQSAQDYQNRYNQLSQQQYGNTLGRANMSIGNRNAIIGEKKQEGATRAGINRQTETDILGIMPWTSMGSGGRKAPAGGDYGGDAGAPTEANPNPDVGSNYEENKRRGWASYT